MGTKKLALLVLTVLLFAIFFLFLDEREKSKKKDKIIDLLQESDKKTKVAYLNLFQAYLKEVEKVPSDILKELENLKNNVDHLDSEVHFELDSVIKRVNEGEHVKGVKDLAKIVESVLKKKAEKDETFKGRPILNQLFDHALKSDWITPRQYENGKLLKSLRNKESHELKVEEPSLTIGLSIFAGIDLIYALK